MKCNRKFYLVILLSIQIFVTFGENIEDDPDLCSEQEIDVCKTKDLQCCAISKDHQCCNDYDYFDQWPSMETDTDAQPRSVGRAVMKMVGFIIGAAVFTILICCVCCFCCPFCLFSKSRSGRVYRQGPAAEPNAGAGQPLQAQPLPPQQGYPSNPGYPQQQQAQAYPPPPPQYPQQSMPYPDDPPPYPGPPLDQAPPLQPKGEYNRQPAYNPNA